MEKFKGFAIQNRSGQDIAIEVINEASFPQEFILKPNQVFYARVADVAKIVPLDWAKKSGFEYLKDVK